MITDILTSNSADAVSLLFTAAATPPDEVQVSLPAGGDMFFRNASAQPYFELGDTLILRRAWAVIPFGFGRGSVRLSSYVRIGKAQGAAGIPAGLPELSTLGFLPFPQVCEPVELDIPVAPVTGTIGTNLRWRLSLMEAIFHISMVNVPAPLIGDNFQMVIFLQVDHTKPMQTLEGP